MWFKLVRNQFSIA